MKKPNYITKTLWNKLKPEEQEVFCEAYNLFYDELNQLSKIHNNVKAHNLALITAAGVGGRFKSTTKSLSGRSSGRVQ